MRKGIVALFLGLAGLVGLVAAWSNWRSPAVNREFIRHMLAMDTVHEQGGKERAIESERLVELAHRGVMVAEATSGLLCVAGALLLPFHWLGRQMGLVGLAVGIGLFFGGFRVVGGEYFQMWQSREWNGLPDAERIAAMFMLIFLAVKDE